MNKVSHKSRIRITEKMVPQTFFEKACTFRIGCAELIRGFCCSSIFSFLVLLSFIVLISGCVKNASDASQAGGASDDERAKVIDLLKQNPLKNGVHFTSDVQIKDVNNIVETWVMGDNVKSAIINGSKATVVITDSSYMVTYISDERTGIRMKLDGQKAHSVFFDPEKDILADSLEVIRREKVSDIDCFVVKAKHSFDSTDCTLWINRENGFVMRLEALSENGEPMVVINHDVVFGAVSESEFSVPSEIMIQELM